MDKAARKLLPLTLSAALFVGCADQTSEDPSSEAFVTRDSVGILIAETGGAIARGALPWVISSTPTLEIGRTDGDSDYLFSGTRGVGKLVSGEIFVIDGSRRQVRFYTPDGRFLSSVGRDGEGPGEFAMVPALVRSLN